MPKEDLDINIPTIKISKEKLTDFFKKYGLILLILVPLLTSVYIRNIPSDVPLTDNWAASYVENYYKNNIQNQVKQQYPNLPEQNLNTLIEQQYADFYKQNKASILKQIKETSQQFKASFKDEKGYTYMPDIDPYTYLRFEENYIKTGNVGDEIKDGVQWDTHSVAPLGRPATSSPHPIILAWFYKFNSFFNKNITPMQSTAYFPILIIALSIIPMFFIGRMVSGNWGGFFAAMMMAVNGALLGRTSWGHADTDAYNIFFALYFIWFFFLALRSNNIKKTAIYSVLAGLTLGIFSRIWAGWWYIFDFAFGTMFIYILYLCITEKATPFSKNKSSEQLDSAVKTTGFLLLSAFIFLWLFTGNLSSVTAGITQPLDFIALKAASHADLWPNVYTTVAELNAASFSSIISSVGGNIFFIISLIGILLLYMTKENDKEGKLKRTHVPEAILLVMWYIGIIYASTKGIRFTMMLVPPLSLGFGAAVTLLMKKSADWLQKIEIPRKITSAVFIIIILIMFMSYTQAAAQAVKNDVPMINDAWYNALTKIKNESQPNAIVNSWWDFGHHFKYFTDRAVTFDGASQNTPMAHWIGKVLLTGNEKEAIGILKMLDCGSNNAFEILNAEIDNTHASVDMLYEIIVLDKTQAESLLLKNGVSRETTQKVIQNTHCTPPEDYFITSEDMVGKGAVWAHFGSWDFNKADAWINAENLPREESIAYIKKIFETTDENAKQIYSEIKSLTDEQEANNWIAPWPGYSPYGDCAQQEEKLICGGIIIDMNTKEVKISTDKGLQNPNSISYLENNAFIVKKFESSLGQSVLLIKKGTGYTVVLSSPQLADSMFTRLFYYGGAGLNQFSKFYEERQVTGQNIIVWKVRWQ